MPRGNVTISDVARRAGMRPGATAWLLAAMLAACAPAPLVAPRADSGRAPANGTQAAYYAALARRGEPVLRIDDARSLVVVEVRRAGPFARFGHDHVVASHALRGEVAPREGRADVEFDLSSLVVDEADLRAAAGFDTKPSPADIEGTRNNMFNRVLHADAHPVVSVALASVRDAPGRVAVEARVTLNGVTRTVPTELTIERTPGTLRVTGRMALRQTDFDLVPLSILNGALQVDDALAIRYDIVARDAAAP